MLPSQNVPCIVYTPSIHQCVGGLGNTKAWCIHGMYCDGNAQFITQLALASFPFVAFVLSESLGTRLL